MSELIQFVAQIPPITRILILSSLSIAGLFAIDIISPEALVCYWPYIGSKWQFWRVFTAFFVCNIQDQPMQSLMDLYMIYSYSRGLEESKFIHLVDYAFYYVIVIPLILLSTSITNALSLQSGLLCALTYTWAISNRNQQVNFYFITMKAAILPVVSLGFRLLLNGKADFIQASAGMFSGYIYNCLETRTCGPLMSLFKKNSQQVSNRVGTLNSLKNQDIEEMYYDGYLPAPSWFRKLVTGNANVAYERPRNNFTNNTNSSGTVRASSSSSGTSTAYTSGTFRGRGHRLGAN